MRIPSLRWGAGAAVALGLASLIGCGASGSATNPPGDTTYGLATDLANAFCAHQASCCSAATGATADGGADAGGGAAASSCGADAGGAASPCHLRALLAADEQLALVATALAEGLLTINQAVSQTCVAAYETRACSATAESVPNVQQALDATACAHLFTGYIPVGERCDMSAECISGAFCLAQATGQNVMSIAGAGSLGVCFPYQQAGDPCNASSDCQAPLTCNPTTLLCDAT